MSAAPAGGPPSDDWKNRTRPTDDPRDRPASQRPALYLVRVLGYQRPHVAGSRHRLDGLAEVVIGRGEDDRAVRGASELVLEISDQTMSSRHARLAPAGATWTIEDLGSRNGTFVDGDKVDRAELTDGALVVLGGTAFTVRAFAAGGPPDVDAEQLETPIPDVRTFSTSFQRELANLLRLAPTSQSIVIHGETGSGKEVIARAIHAASQRPGPFVGVNCGALPPNLVESELFGHKKGAFSGATEDRPGLLRAADRGTLLLDEIGDLPLPTQAALLRVLQEREVMPIGATRAVPIDIRVLAASHRDLEAEVHAGRFREDLWSRLAGYTAEVPALRERREDLGLLIAALLSRMSVVGIRLTSEAGFALLQYDWLEVPIAMNAMRGFLPSLTAARRATAIAERSHPSRVGAVVRDRAPPRSAMVFP